MSMHPQARSQSERPDPAGASRTGGAPLRKFTGTSLPNSKVSDRLINRRDVPKFAIGHLHDGVILLLRPESFSFFFSHLRGSPANSGPIDFPSEKSFPLNFVH